jgi:hypothetical protein
MTNQQRSELDRAIKRAQRAGLVILARGTRKSDGARISGVTSQSRVGAQSEAARAARREASAMSYGERGFSIWKQ